MSFCCSKGEDTKTIRRKLVVCGDGACGKTSLLSVFTRGYFPQVQFQIRKKKKSVAYLPE